MKPYLALPVLAGLLTTLWGAEARAMPVDLANACGALHFAEIRPLIAVPRAVMGYRWLLDSVNNRVVTVSLRVALPNGPRQYDGFTCYLRRNGSLAPGRGSGSGDGGDDDHSDDGH